MGEIRRAMPRGGLEEFDDGGSGVGEGRQWDGGGGARSAAVSKNCSSFATVSRSSVPSTVFHARLCSSKRTPGVRGPPLRRPHPRRASVASRNFPLLSPLPAGRLDRQKKVASAHRIGSYGRLLWLFFRRASFPSLVFPAIYIRPSRCVLISGSAWNVRPASCVPFLLVYRRKR